MRSYSSLPSGARLRLGEFVELYRMHSQSVPEKVAELLADLRSFEALAEQHTGASFDGMRLLDIGCGQKLGRAAYFARRNDVVGIDLDVIARGLSPGPYLTMLRENGWVRVTKTLGRKLLGLDRRFDAEVRRQLGAGAEHPIRVLRMNAERMTFPDAAFDGVVSFSVFEHLADPDAVIREVARVVRPGGIACISLHLYTAENGCHDPRIFSGHRAGIPLWAHLRPRHADLIQPNSFLNRVRLSEWRAMFATHLPGVRFEHMAHGRDRLAPELRAIRAGGELGEYSDEELLTVDLVAIWRRPDEVRSRAAVLSADEGRH
jgi:SAM-dependent methyltransferase